MAGAPLEPALAAIVAGASDALEVPIEDIGDTLRMSGDRRQVVIYDTVSRWRAGHARRIAVDFERVVSEAIKRVKDCGYGIDAACYACL